MTLLHKGLFPRVAFFVSLLIAFAPIPQVLGIHHNFLLNGEYYTGPSDSLYGNLKKIGFYDFIPDATKITVAFLNFNTYEYANQHIGINLGGGLRKTAMNAVYGINFYYDYQRDKSELDQFGIGFEFFSDLISVYGNLYLPFGAERFSRDRVAAKGFDLYLCQDFHHFQCFQSCLSLGIYGLDFRYSASLIGFQGSLTFDILDVFYVEPMVCTDRVFGTDFIVKLGFSYPFCGKANPAKPLYRPVTRRGFVPSKRL